MTTHPTRPITSNISDTKLILPEKFLQCFFGIALIGDTNVDSDEIKQDFPAIFWQLPQDIEIHWYQPQPKSANPNHYYLIQQRLQFETKTFSQAIFSLYQHKLEILYLQLLPAKPPIDAFKNLWFQNFQRKYEICILRTLNRANQFAKRYDAKKISASLLNPALANIFLKSGYSLMKDNKNDNTLIKGYDQFDMIRLLNQKGVG